MCNEVKVNQNEYEVKMQYILDENGKLAEIPKDKCKPVEYPIKYPLINAFEVFDRVDGTENYWVSNYGRCVNNHRSEDDKRFYEHKQGKCHYTIYGIERYPIKNRSGRPTGEMGMNKTKRETSPEKLVVNKFLVKYNGRFKVWHKDGNVYFVKCFSQKSERKIPNLRNGIFPYISRKHFHMIVMQSVA